MLSFDVTDRNIRIIRGVENGGKIRISSATTLNLEEEVIVNGHVKDIPRLATLINQELKTNRMPDKEAIVSISSNLIIFKELRIPKAKDAEFAKMVKAEMQSSVGIDEQYAISYIVTGSAEGKEEDGKDIQVVLATACPLEVVDCYRKVFSMLTISLKSVMVGCNCITKVLLSDPKIKAKMPVLAVQIDDNFISLNLYEKNQLSFSRFASIDPSDYDNSEDYVFEAVNENIFRMLQFQKSRNSSSPIENVVFYGDTHEYVRLTNALEQLDINPSIINVPPQIHGYENLEFSVYANAIGAMFKRNKDNEHVNLLEGGDLGQAIMAKTASSFPAIAITSVVASLLIVGGIYGVNLVSNISTKAETADIKEWMSSPDTLQKLEDHDTYSNLVIQAQDYSTRVANASDAIESKAIMQKEITEKIESCLGSEAYIENFNFVEGEVTMNISIEVDSETDLPSEYPAMLTQKLEELDYFHKIFYTGYSFNETEDSATSEKTTLCQFGLSLFVKGGTDFEVSAETTGEESAE